MKKKNRIKNTIILGAVILALVGGVGAYSRVCAIDPPWAMAVSSKINMSI